MNKSLDLTPVIRFGASHRAGFDVAVNLTTLQETRLLIQGTSGAGKTTALYALLQQTYGLVQHIILDKEGQFPKLREHFDYLLVGAEGEVPINLDAGAVEVVLRKILETRVNAIIDLSDLVPAQQHEYARRVASMMAHLSIKSPLAEHDRLVLVDEFQHFAPETGRGSATSTEAMIELASLGRKRGFCLVGATTRVSLLSKSIVELLDNKMIGRCGLDDAARAAQLLNFSKEERRQLTTLATGEFYAFGPAIAADPLLVRSDDDLKVRPPRRGERRLTPATPAAVQDVLAAFDDVPREAKEEARTIEELQAQVDTLSRQLKKAQKGVAIAPAVDVEKIRAEAKLEAEKAVSAHRTKLEGIQGRATMVRDESIRITGLLEELSAELARFTLSPATVQPRQRLHSTTVEEPRASGATSPDEGRGADSVKSNGNGAHIGGTPQKILNALLLLEVCKVRPAPKEVVGGIVGIVSSSGTWRTYMSRLNTEDLIVKHPDGSLELSEKGRAFATDEGLPASRRELHELWLARLSGKPRQMLAFLLHCYPDSVTREALGAHVGIRESGTYRTYLSKLRSRGLAVDTKDGELRAADLLFPPGMKP